MTKRLATLAALTLAITLEACATYYPAPPPPPPGWSGESWGRHVARCERRYPHYDPRTDLIYRRGATFACPL